MQEALNSPAEMVQFHALSLLHEIKQKDRLAVSKARTHIQAAVTALTHV